jgi:hypothetical protein
MILNISNDGIEGLKDGKKDFLSELQTSIYC